MKPKSLLRNVLNKRWSFRGPTKKGQCDRDKIPAQSVAYKTSFTALSTFLKVEQGWHYGRTNWRIPGYRPLMLFD